MTIAILATIRAALASHPLVPWLAALLVLAGCRAAAPRYAASLTSPRLLAAAAWLVLSAFVAIVGWYAWQLAYFDPAEPTITAVAAVLAAGRPLYPALDAPERYAHIYGPVLFIIHALALTAAGPSIAASKAVGAAAVLASVAAGWRLFAAGGRRVALAASAACAALYLAFGDVTFWTRADPLLILCVVLGLLAAQARGQASSSWALGAVIGVAVNLKLTGPLYLVPAIALVCGRGGWPAAFRVALLAAVVGAAPFALPNISLTHYLEYVALSARNGVAGATLRHNLEWALFLGTPLLMARSWRVRRGATGDLDDESSRRRMARAALWLIAAMLVVAVAAAKPGGGPFHLLPFVPTVLFLVAAGARRDGRDRPASLLPIGAVVAVALAIAVPAQALFIHTVHSRDLRQAQAEVRGFIAAHPGTDSAIGYAGTSFLSLVRPEAVFRTGDYLLDAPAVQEHRLAGLPLPASTLRAISDCVVPVWLIPAGAGPPFAVPSAYAPLGPSEVFPREFREAFMRRYERTSTTGLFEVWTCRAGGSPLQ